MSQFSKYTASVAPREQVPEERRRRYASPGVDVVISGWKPGMSKVRLSQVLRAGGIGLDAAVELSGAVLEGRSVRVHLGQFRTLEEAREALGQIGVAQVSAVATT